MFVETEATALKRDNLELVFLNVHGRYGGQNTEDYRVEPGCSDYMMAAERQWLRNLMTE